MARRFGYSRVSTSDQDWSLQLEALTMAGVDNRDIFREKASGANRQRTELRRTTPHTADAGVCRYWPG
jgi:DNA invertase Pin-like site-specific DNA recombinase